MRRLALGLAACVACGSSNDTRAHRTGSAAPVELVPEPVYADGGKAETPAGEESEPNDTADTATPLALGATMRGKVEPPDTDVDRFRIDVTQAGALMVSLSSADAGLVLDVEDAAGNLLAHSDRGGRATERIPNLGVTPGRYTAVVRATRPKPNPKKKGPEPPAPVYEITAQVAPVAAGSEREPNNDRGTANDILVGDHMSGYVGWDKDADVWKLSVEALSGKTPLEIDVGKVDGVALEVKVSDALGNPIATRQAPRNAPAAIHDLLPVVPAGGAPYEYITVSGDRSNPEAPYDLVVSTGQLNADMEVEPDDTPEHPFEIAPERAQVHGTWTPGDVDCYLVATGPVPHNVDVVLDAPKQLELTVEILADGKPLGKPGTRATAKVPGNARTIIRVKGGSLASGSYDLHIKDLGLPDVDKQP